MQRYSIPTLYNIERVIFHLTTPKLHSRDEAFGVREINFDISSDNDRLVLTACDKNRISCCAIFAGCAAPRLIKISKSLQLLGHIPNQLLQKLHQCSSINFMFSTLFQSFLYRIKLTPLN